jgi:hypothetical protein
MGILLFFAFNVIIHAMRFVDFSQIFFQELPKSSMNTKGFKVQIQLYVMAGSSCLRLLGIYVVVSSLI